MNSLPKNFGAAFDLSSLKNPIPAQELFGISINQEKLMQDVLPASHAQVVILICWSPRSTESQAVMAALGKIYEEDSAKSGGAGWLLGNVNVDLESAVAQALQVQTVPLALAIIQEQVVPLFETVPTVPQLRMVIDKVLALAIERGIGTPASALEEKEEELESEEIRALDALEVGDFIAAKMAYQEWLSRAPGNSFAQLGLIQVELLLRTSGIDSAEVIARAERELSNFKLQQLAADCEMAQGDFEAAFTRLIAGIKISSGDDRKEISGHVIRLFALVDPTDPILIRARQQLASVLF